MLLKQRQRLFRYIWATHYKMNLARMVTIESNYLIKIHNVFRYVIRDIASIVPIILILIQLLISDVNHD